MAKERVSEVIWGSPDRPLVIDNIEIPCYVLEDEMRVFVQSAVIGALGMSYGGTQGRPERLAKFATQDRIKPFLDNEIANRIANPIRFQPPRGGRPAYGYEATILADICFAVIDADGQGKLQKQQKHIAERARILARAWAKVGIIALVDEVTGYQEVRDRNYLQKILEAYVEQENYRQWTRTFPDEFYKEMFRLKGWSLSDPRGLKRPSVVGRYTNDLIYDRLAPGVLKELQRRNPTNEKGRRKVRHHQWLTGEIGHPALKEHLTGIIALERAAPNWAQFQRMVQRAYPKPNEQMPLLVE